MPKNNLVRNDQYVQALAGAIAEGEIGLKHVPDYVVRVVDEEMWRERVIQKTGELVRFERFCDFVETPPLEGLGIDLNTLKRLCYDNAPAKDAIDRATAQKPGNPTGANQYTDGIDNNGNNSMSENVRESDRSSPVGNMAGYALRRLRREKPELHARVLAGELTPHAAMIEAGFRQKTAQIYPTDVDRTARILLRHFEGDDLDKLVSLLITER